VRERGGKIKQGIRKRRRGAVKENGKGWGVSKAGRICHRYLVNVGKSICIHAVYCVPAIFVCGRDRQEL